MKRIQKLLKTNLSRLAELSGSPTVFAAALAFVGLWLALGPYFKFSDGWQLAINTSTTIITFLLAFSIQFSQNRDTKAIKSMLRGLMRQSKELEELLKEIDEGLDD